MRSPEAKAGERRLREVVVNSGGWVSHVYTIANEVFGVYGEPWTYGVNFNRRLRPRS
jgi:hypothetical protein